ncbi:transcription factor 25 [Impatiens glandulifera]|uniref:transcription factor 25 n=1 Tax=Impatiens glandulifera TaxID=253017 RepID=UPI001FB14F6F|nr:transcription factor 25 [Impatiens glandulifera]
MSGRLLKKFLEEKEAIRLNELKNSADSGIQDDDNISNDPPESPITSNRKINPFDLLENEDNDDDDQEEESTVSESAGDTEFKGSSKASVKSVPPTNNKAKKKKKKKNKGDTHSNNDRKEEKPVEVILAEISLMENASSRGSDTLNVKSSSSVHNGLVKKCKQSVLQIDPKFLSAENELKRIFGTKVVNSFQTGSSRQSHGSGMRGGHPLRKTILVTPSAYWQRWDGYLEMELLETRDEKHYFRYVYSSAYEQAQSIFEANKANHDVQGIANIVALQPYHLDSLITMAEYFRFSGEQQMASDLLAKCLYALECAWHPMFSPLRGNCQLKYNHKTNKPFYVTLFTHMRNMDKRGCHRSALEICKLMLSLDSDDPMGTIFCIDYFALRAEEYTWLEQFSEEYGDDNSLWLFPNFSYSLAISRFYLESQSSSVESAKATSADLMYQALMLHPLVVKKLVAKVPLKDRAWDNILKNNFFKSDRSGNPTLDHLINIYVERSYIIWRLPDLQKLLRDSALRLIDMLESGKNDAQDWACIRQEAFSSDKNMYSHLLVSDFSETIATMPPEEIQNLVHPRVMGDPQILEHVGNIPNNVPAPRDVTDRNPLAVLLESMLPWVDYGRNGDGEDPMNNHAPNAED